MDITRRSVAPNDRNHPETISAQGSSPSTVDVWSIASAYGLSSETSYDPGFGNRENPRSQLHDRSTSTPATYSKHQRNEVWGSDNDGSDVAYPLIDILRDHKAHADIKPTSTTFDRWSDSVEALKGGVPEPSIRRALWTPPWLRTTSLLGFAFLFTALWIALVVLVRYDIANSGFMITATSSRFSWTYGPTAIFVAITGLWRQVDYHSKMHQPWQQMARGPSPGPKSLLLDYVSPILSTGLVRSFRNGHWIAAATMTGSAVLKLATLLSTTLMVPVAIKMSGPLPIQVNSAFDGSAFWQTTNWSLNNRTDRTILSGNVTYSSYSFSNISAVSAVKYLQVLQGQISEPVGTQEGIVFQDASVTETPGISDIEHVSANVDSIVPHVICEEPDITVFDKIDGNITEFSGALEVQIPSCGNTRILLSTCADGSESCLGTLTTYNIYRAYCSDKGRSDGSQVDLRLLLIASNITQRTKPGTEYYSFDYTTSMANITAVSCKVAYTMGKSILTMGTNKNETLIHPKEPLDADKQLDELTDQQLSELLYSVLVAADSTMDGPRRDIGNSARKYTSGNDTGGSAAMFELMSHTSQDLPAGYYKFFEIDTMIASATSVITQLAVNFLKESFMTESHGTASAEGTYTQERLRFRPLSLWIMVVSLMMLGLLALSIIFQFTPSVSQDPSLLASNAAILARSPSIDTILAPLGACRTSQVSYELSGHRFSTDFDGSKFRIQAREILLADGSFIRKPKQKQRSWIPMTARLYFVIATFTLPLVTIIALEVAYRQSIKSNGFTVQDMFWALYGTQYSSALIVLAIASIFNSLDFTITTFSILSVMRARAIPSYQGITNNPMGEVTPVALCKALRRGHIGLSSSILAALLGSVLSIVVSNLWAEKLFTTNINFNTQLKNTWNLDWSDSAVNDGGAATLLNDVRLNKTESPDSATWNDLVFPSFDSVGSPDDEYHILKLGGSNQKFNFSIEVPSLRPRLFCHPATVRDRGVSTTGGAVSTTITAIDLLPETCRVGDDSQVRNVSFKATGDKTDGLVGLFFDLDIGVLVSKQCSPCKTNPDSARPYNPMGCPSIGIFFAERPFVCSQVVQQVRVGMKFTSLIGPKGEIIFQRSSLTSSPTPNESTAKNLTRDDSELDLFPYRIQPHFDKNVTNSISDDPADPFFRYILSGTTGVSRDDLTKNPDQLIDVVNGLYTKFMVQVMDSSIFRTPIVASTQTKEQNEKQSVNGTISREESRLIMNYTPKLILQILLGAMMILGLTAYIMVDLKGTLPRSPHSIASSMALFAGSELCANHIPEDAEWMNKQQLDRIFQGYTFALGWWSRSATEADSRSIDSLLDAPVVDERFGIDVGTPERLGFEAKGNRDGRLWGKWSAL
ncbi:uncharacterized protein CCOS01_14742 [Colletotrichum costaricense]|uniref:Uncharacterized protein n=1 Tax=Colletotrichum costaricense TaxID=1209916 RepID=A0AAI9YJ69_9PEZI|nr:uncharacterized protein CCOS01_14742 [Colletotrichum costaricense]KAK1512502.1 hypothetical protein CCOS01_14742 [Colletotrichum costaricense]